MRRRGGRIITRINAEEEHEEEETQDEGVQVGKTKTYEHGRKAHAQHTATTTKKKTSKKESSMSKNNEMRKGKS